MLLFVCICILFCVHHIESTSTPRDEIESYLKEVYRLPSQKQWDSLSDTQLFQFFNNLTYYYPNAPKSPIPTAQRQQSHLYAGTVCDCLHIQLDLCRSKTPGACTYYPLPMYLGME